MLVRFVVSVALAFTTWCSVGSAARAESSEDTRKFDWLVLQSDVGYRSLHIKKVEFDKGEEVPKLVSATSYAVAPALSVGVRLWFISLMARPEVAFFRGSRSSAFDDTFRLWSFDLELLFRAPLGRVQPYLLLGGGYSAMGALSDVIDERRRAADARGGNVRAGLGFDVFLGDYCSMGLRGTIDGVFLSSKVPVSTLIEPEQVDTIGQAERRARQADGFISGVSPNVAFVLGLRL